MAGGSTRAAFNVSFQRDSNIGDITAKATSQTICTSMAGTVAGMALAGWLGQDVWMACGASAALASIHMGAALMYDACRLPCILHHTHHVHMITRCVRSVPLTVVNPTRCEALAAAFIAGGSLPGPLHVAAQETLWSPWWCSLRGLPAGDEVAVNPVLSTTVPAATLSALLTNAHANARYLVLAHWDGGTVLQSAVGHSEQGPEGFQGIQGTAGPCSGGAPLVSLLVHERAESSDVASGMLHAYLLRAWLAGKRCGAARAVVEQGLHTTFARAVVEAQWDATRVAVLENRKQRFVWL